jgi:hypothetical protein
MRISAIWLDMAWLGIYQFYIDFTFFKNDIDTPTDGVNLDING